MLDSLLFLSASCAVAPSTTARIRSHKSVGTLQEWALQDTAATYTVGDGERRVTFWNSLATEHPALRHASVETLLNRAALLGLTVGPEPKLLGSAQRIDDGRWSGTVDGHVRTINAASEGRLASGEHQSERANGPLKRAERAVRQFFSLKPQISNKRHKYSDAVKSIPQNALGYLSRCPLA